jgi:hypothetical protein
MTNSADQLTPPRRRAHLVLALMAGAGLSVALAGCGAGASTPAQTSPVPAPKAVGSTQQISNQNLGYLWPLSVDHGMIECRAGNQAVFTAPDGKTYALNNQASLAGFAAITPIRTKGAAGGNIGLGSLRSHALRLCTAQH